MARERYRIEWVILGAVLAVVLGLVVVFGPGLYRKGKGVVAPIVEMARSDDAVQALNQELPFSPPADGRVDEERLLVFLAVRRELLSLYERWDETVATIDEGQGGDSWEDATVVLEETRRVFRAQVELLREHRMSPAEFRWLEERVYDTWWDDLSEQQSGESPESILCAQSREQVLRAQSREQVLRAQSREHVLLDVFHEVFNGVGHGDPLHFILLEELHDQGTQIREAPLVV